MGRAALVWRLDALAHVLQHQLEAGFPFFPPHPSLLIASTQYFEPLDKSIKPS